jgi:hypothetical protein
MFGEGESKDDEIYNPLGRPSITIGEPRSSITGTLVPREIIPEKIRPPPPRLPSIPTEIIPPPLPSTEIRIDNVETPEIKEFKRRNQYLAMLLLQANHESREQRVVLKQIELTIQYLKQNNKDGSLENEILKLQIFKETVGKNLFVINKGLINEAVKQVPLSEEDELKITRRLALLSQVLDYIEDKGVLESSVLFTEYHYLTDFLEIVSFSEEDVKQIMERFKMEREDRDQVEPESASSQILDLVKKMEKLKYHYHINEIKYPINDLRDFYEKNFKSKREMYEYTNECLIAKYLDNRDLKIYKIVSYMLQDTIPSRISDMEKDNTDGTLSEEIKYMKDFLKEETAIQTRQNNNTELKRARMMVKDIKINKNSILNDEANKRDSDAEFKKKINEKLKADMKKRVNLLWAKLSAKYSNHSHQPISQKNKHKLITLKTRLRELNLLLTKDDERTNELKKQLKEQLQVINASRGYFGFGASKEKIKEHQQILDYIDKKISAIQKTSEIDNKKIQKEIDDIEEELEDALIFEKIRFNRGNNEYVYKSTNPPASKIDRAVAVPENPKSIFLPYGRNPRKFEELPERDSIDFSDEPVVERADDDEIVDNSQYNQQFGRSVEPVVEPVKKTRSWWERLTKRRGGRSRRRTVKTKKTKKTTKFRKTKHRRRRRKAFLI